MGKAYEAKPALSYGFSWSQRGLMGLASFGNFKPFVLVAEAKIASRN
jgi:hypothetical protein